MSINTIDAIQDVAAQSSTKKQTGNLSAYLFKNSPGARETGAFTDSVVGLTQTTAKGLAEVFETIAHPQKLSKIQNMAKNTIREIFGYKDESDNRKAGQIKRYASKHRHEPHKPNISYKNTQSSHTITPLSSDPRYKKLIKFPFYAGGKVIKIPARTLATVSHAIADIGERRQQQELRHMIHGKFTKADRSKTKSSRNKLTSRSSTTTEAPTKENKTSSKRGRLPRNRKKKESQKNEEKNTSEKNNSFATNQTLSKPKTEKIIQAKTKKPSTSQNKKQESAKRSEPKKQIDKEKKPKETMPEKKEEIYIPDSKITEKLDLADKARDIDRKNITRKDLQDNPDIGFIFGDNLTRKGDGGQAKAMRGEKNALGIATLHAPDTYFSDEDFPKIQKELDQDIKKVHDRIDSGKPVIIPKDGIGTGIADLANKAPKIKKYLDQELEKITDKVHKKFPDILL